jgi:serine/threonine-protein kinase RsbW
MDTTGATVAKHVSMRPITIPGRLDVKVASDPVHLASVRKSVEALAASAGFSEKDVGEIGLCLNEAMANIIRHAYSGRTDRPIQLSAVATAEALTIELRDWGNGIDPSRLPHRPYNPLEPGGVGLICLDQWMDEVSYAPQPDGMLTTLKRRLKRRR